MEKLAHLVKEAEVRGVLAGLVDGGLLKVASLEELEMLTQAVASSIEGYDYSLEDVLEKTAAVLKVAEEDEANAQDEPTIEDVFNDLTELHSSGKIDDETYEAALHELSAILDAASEPDEEEEDEEEEEGETEDDDADEEEESGSEKVASLLNHLLMAKKAGEEPSKVKRALKGAKKSLKDVFAGKEMREGFQNFSKLRERQAPIKKSLSELNKRIKDANAAKNEALLADLIMEQDALNRRMAAMKQPMSVAIKKMLKGGASTVGAYSAAAAPVALGGYMAYNKLKNK